MTRLSMLVCCMVIGFGLIPATTANAHTWQTYSPLQRWEIPDPDWACINDIPTGSFRDRISNGVVEWNGRNQSVIFYSLQQARVPYDPARCNLGFNYNSIHWEPRDGTTLAVTHQCEQAGVEKRSTNMVIDSTRSWYTGTGLG